MDDTPAYPEYDDFSRHAGEEFTLLPGEGQAVPMRLVRVEARVPDPLAAATGAPLRQVPFSLVFEVAWEAGVPQGIYAVSHERLGRHDIFLVPIGPAGEGLGLQAVFT